LIPLKNNLQKKAMTYLVKRNIIHNDLKRENIFITTSDYTGHSRAVVGNFGKSLNKDVDKDAYRIFNNGVVRFICTLNKLAFLILQMGAWIWLKNLY
jgi:hypothetical protein